MQQTASVMRLPSDLVAHGMRVDGVDVEARNEMRGHGEHFSVERVRATIREARAVPIPYDVTAAARRTRVAVLSFRHRTS